MDPGIRTLDRYDAGLILGCCVFLYANLFASPGTPFLLGGDQVFFWADGQRLLHGERLYRDFFQFTAPGADLIYLGVFKLFGPRIWVPNLVVLLLGTSLCLACLLISRSIMSRMQAALATAFYVVFVIGGTLDGTHHWFSLLAVMCAVVVLMGGRTTVRIVIAGALLGLATFITQTRGPAAAVGIAAWLLWERSRTQQTWSSLLKQQVLLFAPLILAWSALSAYYLVTVGPQQLWFFQVSFARECAVSGWNAASIGLPKDLFNVLPWVRWIFAYILLPLACGIFLWKYWRSVPSENAARLGLVTLIAAVLFIEVGQSPSWFRFYCISLPGVILLVSLTGRTRLLWMGVIGLAAYHTWSLHVHNSAVVDLPAGRVAAPPPAAQKLAWLAGHTQPGQFMLQAGWPGMYLPLGLRNPVYLDVIPGCSSPIRRGYVESSIRQLEAKRVQYIVWSPGYSSPPQFHEFLVERYRLTRRFSDLDEIWERR